ncbi:TATA-box-binding protein [Halorussus salinus]|uniref:hypothetical protein n=1 Tax=Halorussus salinus TaxID=1364935 RepID=UPI00138F2A89|nr:hypothetical protein [Halorussus salinus]
MSENTISVAELRSRVSELPITLSEGENAAYASVDQAFSLESVVIALDEEDCVYDEETFSGVAYQPDSPLATVVVSGDGTIVALDAREQADAKTAVSQVVDKLDDLGLLTGDSSPELSTDTRAVPFALDAPAVETLGYDDES